MHFRSMHTWLSKISVMKEYPNKNAEIIEKYWTKIIESVMRQIQHAIKER